MAKKLKCPFCGTELQETFGAYMCRHAGCKISCCLLPTCMIEALIQAKQDLAIATKANDEIRGEYEMHHGAERERCFTINWEVVAKKMYNYANKALEQIEHKEQK